MARLRSGIHLIKRKRRSIDVQSVYAWITIFIGFILMVVMPLESMVGIIGRAIGTGLIIIGLVWEVIIGLQRWWSH